VVDRSQVYGCFSVDQGRPLRDKVLEYQRLNFGLISFSFFKFSKRNRNFGWKFWYTSAKYQDQKF